MYYNCICRILSTSICERAEWSKEWAHCLGSCILCSALHNLLGADCAGAGGTRRARNRLGALHFGAPCTGAGRALTLGLLTFSAVKYDRGLLGDARFEDILGKVRYTRAFGLQHVLGHIGADGRGRYR